VCICRSGGLDVQKAEGGDKREGNHTIHKWSPVER
jgi:hypothetical protein